MQVLVKLKIHGRVQGVFFRQSTREKARELGLSGWVRNMPDGTVEALATGPENVVNELIAWCQHGPAYARVDKVDVAVSKVEDAHSERVPLGQFEIT